MSSSSTPVRLDTQVGGHDGVLSSAHGSVIIKPCLPLEIEFYTALASNEALAHLRRFVPKFYGTLKLQGQMDEQGNIGSVEGQEQGKDEPCHCMALVSHRC
jgi:1D-myo-inositol-tetrakisphosphate 5-kinase/inositol-polyphosphate multikinase